MINPIDLDLVFTSDPNQLLPSQQPLKDFHRLKDSQLWNNDLRNWLEFIRSDKNLLCPDIVRNNSSFSMGLQLTDDLTISKINTIWRNKEEATDVLSFAALDNTLVLPANTCIELGDIIVSVPTATIQAMDNEHSLEKELRWLISHGLLHLLGWEHPTEKKLKEMLNCQEQLLNITTEDQHQKDPIMI